MTPNNKLPEEIVARIDSEARQFAFYNYVTQLLHPNAVFERMDTWHNDARVCYYSILHYMTRPDICWPHKETTLATEYAIKLQQADKANAALEETLRGKEEQFKEAKDLLREVFQKPDTGFLSDRLIYVKIKKFLYGE